ncbi:hypothetical protein ACWDFR_36540 [Streptomyces sp. 900105755]|uniref:hypothetical protein n=1 Tax=Streptomyces sp. NPDC001507 TaxID=3364579 RepID=UPI0036B10CA7
MPVPLSGEDCVELLPERWQAINAYGIRIKHRTYDSPEWNPRRRQCSGVTAKKGLLAAPPDRPPTIGAAPRPAGHTLVGGEPSHHSVDIATHVPWQYTGVAGEVTNCRVGCRCTWRPLTRRPR